MNENKIKAIGFDYSGVLAGLSGPKFNIAVGKILDITVKEYEDVYFKMNNLLNTGNLSRDDFWKEFLKRFDKLDKHKELIDFIDSIDHHKIDEKVLGIIKDLKNKKYKLGLFTNQNFSQAKGIRERLSAYFDEIVVSSEIGAMKPEVKAFQLFFDRLGVKPEEAIFIDDSKESLLYSRELNYKPILFIDAGQLKKDLEKLGV